MIPLLFQTGYLTIVDFEEDPFGQLFTLSYPNFEVKRAFLTYLLSAYNEVESALTNNALLRLLRALYAGDFERFASA